MSTSASETCTIVAPIATTAPRRNVKKHRIFWLRTGMIVCTVLTALFTWTLFATCDGHRHFLLSVSTPPPVSSMIFPGSASDELTSPPSSSKKAWEVHSTKDEASFPTCSFPHRAAALLALTADVAGTAATFLPYERRRAGTATMHVLLLLEVLALACAVLSVARDLQACWGPAASVLGAEGDYGGAVLAGRAGQQCHAGVTAIAVLAVVAAGVAAVGWACRVSGLSGDPSDDLEEEEAPEKEDAPVKAGDDASPGTCHGRTCHGKDACLADSPV